MLPDKNTPILVGCGDVTDLVTPIERGRSPYDLIAQAGKFALADAGGSEVGADRSPRLHSFSIQVIQ